MYEHYIHSYVNPTFVIDSEYQAVKIPAFCNQILRSDKRGECVEFSSNKRTIVGGLRAGVFTDTQVFYNFVPEISILPNIDLDNLERNRRSNIHINNLTMENFSFNLNKDVNQRYDCNLKQTDDTYIVQK